MQIDDLNFILDILQGKNSAYAPDWASVLGYLEINRVAGYFLRRAEDSQITLPVQVASCLRRVEQYQAKRTVQMRAWLKEVTDALEHEHIEYAVLKGNILTNADLFASGGNQSKKTCYSDGERVSNDIDLLVLPSEIGKVENALGALGFVQGYYDDAARMTKTMTRREILERRLNRGETVPFQRILNSSELPHVEVDINFSLDYLPNGMKDVLISMMKRTNLYALREGGAVRSLETIDFLIHLILHQYKEMRVYSMVMRGKDLELYKLLDIYLMLKRVPQKALYERICKYAVEFQAGVVLKTVMEFFDNLEICRELMEIAKMAEGSQEQNVLDPTQRDKQYMWTCGPKERAINFNHATSFLKCI